MFNIGSGELALIAVVALLVLGPKRLPELARGIGKFMREFRRQTDDIRGVVEREFYRLDQDMSIHEPPPTIRAPDGITSVNGTDIELPALESSAPLISEAQAPAETSTQSVDMGDPPQPPSKS